MKVGVIGAGYWGSKHVDEYTKIGVKVVVADLSEENRKLCKEKYNAEATDDYKKLLADPEIKAISICSPNKTHYPFAKDCLNAGKNILVEKPLATSVEEAEELVKLAKEKNLFMTVGHIYRYNNAVDKVKELIESGELGEIYSVKIKWINTEYTFQPDFHKRVFDRDVLWDLAIHPFDMINYLFGENPEQISCIGESYQIKDKIETIFISCKLKKILMNVELSWVTPPKTRILEIIGSKKSVFVECIPQKIKIFDNATEKITDLPIKENNTIQTELMSFLNCVEGNETSRAPATIGLDNVKMLIATEQALKEKKTILLK